MAHNLNIEDGKAAMMYVGQVPWHGLGTRLEEPPATTAEAIEAAMLDWEVGLKPVYCADGEHYYEIPNRKAVVRLDKWGEPDLVPFGLVGKDYQVLQNRDAFAFFDPILTTGKATIETAGALGNGERVWAIVKVDGDVSVADNDTVDRYLLLSTGHDGKTAVQIRFTPVRVVCQNTLTVATSFGKDFAKVYHVPGMRRELRNAQEDLQSILSTFEKLEAGFRRMVKMAIDDVRLQVYLKQVFPDPPKRSGQSNAAYEKTLRKIVELRSSGAHYFHEGKGNDAANVQGTLWAAYNGVVELLDHHKTYRDRWHRLKALWFGDELRIKQRAFEEANKMVSA